MNRSTSRQLTRRVSAEELEHNGDEEAKEEVPHSLPHEPQTVLVQQRKLQTGRETISNDKLQCKSVCLWKYHLKD